MKTSTKLKIEKRKILKETLQKFSLGRFALITLDKKYLFFMLPPILFLGVFFSVIKLLN